jgi:excisionase family DNA binding protein
MNASSKLQRFYNIREVAQQVGVCTKTIRRLIDSGELHIHRLRRQIRISEEDLIAFLNKNRT